MLRAPMFRAFLCHSRALRGAAIAIAIAACGGSVVAPGGGTAADRADASDAARGDAGGGEGASPDAGACARIDPSSYDPSCHADSDCVAIGVGTLCTNGPSCMCPAAAINVRDQATYESDLKAIESTITPGPGGCHCPYFGSPRCSANHCVLCGGASGSCPDGG